MGSRNRFKKSRTTPAPVCSRCPRTGGIPHCAKSQITEDIPANNLGGATIFNKFTAELRYPLSLNPSSTIFGLLFLEGGNAWKSFEDYSPFDLKRSAGVGVRAYLPMFGLLGFDFGYGWDNLAKINSGAKWTEFGNFNIILGFEPD